MPPGGVILGFAADTGITDPDVLSGLEAALQRLAEEKKRH
jgi:hypothetical protein